MKNERRGQTRRPLARIHVIHEEILNGRYPNCRSLAEAFEVSVKTVQRDLDFMRDEFHMPIEWDAVLNGYRYTAPVHRFPPAQIGAEELMALFVARKVMAPLAGTAVEHALREGFRRLADMAGASIHISWQDLDKAFSVHEPGLMPTDLARVELLSTALVSHRKLYLRYRSAKTRRLKARVVHPLHLAQFQGGWYLFAFDESVREVRIFALPRMQDVDLLPDTFVPPADFDMDRYLQGSLGLVTEPDAPETEVVILFTGYAAVLVAERNWHSSQKIESLEDGTTRVRLRLRHLDDVVPWVVSWGGMAEVEAPAPLRKKVADCAKKSPDNMPIQPAEKDGEADRVDSGRDTVRQPAPAI